MSVAATAPQLAAVCAAAYPSAMPNIHDDPAALKALQDEIYREKILRARKMTVEERLADAIELTNAVFHRMLEGAMWQLGVTDESQGWREVRARLSRLAAAHDAGRWVTEKPA